MYTNNIKERGVTMAALKVNEFLVVGMEKHGYYFDEDSSYRGCLRFYTRYTGMIVYFTSWKMVKQYLRECIFD